VELDDYVNLFFRSTTDPNRSVFSVTALCFLAAARIAPIIAFSPFFGARVLPNPVKMVLTMCFVVMLLPKLVFSLSTPLSFSWDFMLLMLREVMIGAIIGFFLGLPFLIVSSAGVYIDHQRGAASLMVNDPTLQNQSSPIGTLYNLMLICLFWAIDGPFRVIDILTDSYDLFPPDQFFSPVFLHDKGFIHQALIKISGSFAALSLQLAMPALLILLMTDTFLGIINRLAPQVQITFLGMALKSWFALFLVCIGLYPFFEYLTKILVDWVDDVAYLVAHFNLYEPKGLETVNLFQFK
jgi:type III secretion protein T